MTDKYNSNDCNQSFEDCKLYDSSVEWGFCKGKNGIRECHKPVKGYETCEVYSKLKANLTK